MAENVTSRQDSKFDLWERKLLDLTARNSLLNVKMKGNNVPVITKSAARIEDLLSEEKDYTIESLKKPEAHQAQVQEQPQEELQEQAQEELQEQPQDEPQDIEAGLQNGKLYSDLTESDLQERLKALYRNSRTAIEEDGAGTLFLA